MLIVAMGILVALNGWKSLNNKIFFLVALGSIGWVGSLHEAWVYIGNLDWDGALPLMRLSYAFSVLGTTLMTIFIYYFPTPSIVIPRILQIIYLFSSILLFFLAGFTSLVNKNLLIEENTYVSDVFGPLQLVYILSVLLNLFIAAYLSIKKYNKATGLNKNKMALVLSGYFAFVVTAILTNVVLPLFNIYVIQSYSQFLIVFFLVPTFFALQRYRFFNFSNASLNVLRKIITYSIYLSVVTFCYILLNYYLPPGALRGIISAFIAIIVFNYAEKYIPLMVTSSFKHFKDTLTKFKSKASYCNTYYELEKLIEEIFIIELNYVNAKVFVVRKNIGDVDLNVYKENNFTKKLISYSKDFLVKEEIDFRKLDVESKKMLNLEMENLNADLILPLFSEKNLIGFFALKKKNVEEPYTSELLNDLLSTKKDLEIGLMNILLKMNLQEENNLMKSIIDKKTRELKKKIIQIKELVDQQSDFIAVTAHEFRTPLSIASFQLEDIIHSKKVSAKDLEELTVVEASIENLKELTERLFAVQQYDLNKVALNKKKIEIGAFLKNIFTDFLPITKEKNQILELSIPKKPQIFAQIDQVQMRQVMHNLLKNASKFTPEKGRIILTVEKKMKKIIISVEDDGQGIPDDLKKAVFEKFRTKSSGGGIGLGLYLCKKTIELHKGKLWVEDSSSGGASFKIELAASNK